MVRFTLAVLLSTAPVQAPSDDATAIVVQAQEAVQGDSVEAAERRWSRILARDPAHRRARLGLAVLARLTHRDSAAEQGYRRILEDSTGPADDATVRAALGLALLLRPRGELATADSLLDAAVDESRRLQDPGLTAEVLASLAQVRHRTAGAGAALPLLRQADSIAPPADQRVHAMIRCSRARVLSDLRDPETLDLARAGEDLARRAGDPRLAASCMGIQAIEHTRLGNADAGLAAYAGAADLFLQARDRGGRAAVLQWRSYLLSTVGLLGEARRDAEEAIRDARVTGREDLIPWALSTLATVALQLGDVASALPHASQATALFTARGDRFGTLSSGYSEANIAAVMGDLDAARSGLVAVVRGTREIGWPDMEVSALESLMHVALETGDLEAARGQWDRAIGLAREAGLAGRVGALRYHGAVLSLLAGELEQPERVFRELLASPDLQPNWRYLVGARLAEALARQGRVEAAEREIRTASLALDRWREQLGDADLRVLAFQLAEDRADPDLGIATVIAALARAGRVASAFELTERGRARELADRLTRAAAADLTGAGAVRHEGGPVTLDSLRAALPDDSVALLEFVTGHGDETTLIVVTREGAWTHVLPPRDALAPAIARLIALLEADGDPRPIATELGASLLGPALPALPPAVRRLLIIPHGPLHRLPFDLLILPGGDRVLERFTVSYAPSATVVVQLRNRRAGVPPGGLAALADPRFTSDPEGALVEAGIPRSPLAGDTALPRLRGAAREAAAVARYSDHVTVRRRGEASEAWLKTASLTGYGVIHFATHALVNDGSIARTALALAPGDGEDGFVGAGELAALSLDAELVVLSACRTAGGRLVHGEGIQGLAAPLFGAGARAIAATWWPIGDRATVRLMDDFYAAMADGQAAADALRAAKLAALRRGAPPREWAAFALFGDPLARPVLRPPAAPGAVAWGGAGLGIILVLAAAYGLVTRRGWRGEGRTPSRPVARTHHR